MPRGLRTADMKPDAALERDPDPVEIIAHPNPPTVRAGNLEVLLRYTIQCRSCDRVSDGMAAEKPEGYRLTLWFCGLPTCQESFLRRQKLLRWRQLGSPVLERARRPDESPGPPVPVDVSEFIPDEWVG